MNTWPMAENHDVKGKAKIMMSSIRFPILLNHRPGATWNDMECSPSSPSSR